MPQVPLLLLLPQPLLLQSQLPLALLPHLMLPPCVCLLRSRLRGCTLLSWRPQRGGLLAPRGGSQPCSAADHRCGLCSEPTIRSCRELLLQYDQLRTPNLAFLGVCSTKAQSRQCHQISEFNDNATIARGYQSIRTTPASCPRHSTYNAVVVALHWWRSKQNVVEPCVCLPAPRGTPPAARWRSHVW